MAGQQIQIKNSRIFYYALVHHSMDAIAEYSSSDTDADAEDTPSEPPRPPEPQTGSRKGNRQFPHVDGQFACSVFINAPAPPSTALDIPPKFTAIPADELHLSLSRTVPIVDAQRRSLLAELTKAVKKVTSARQITKLDVRIGPQTLRLANDDASRTFLALAALDPTNTLHDLVDATTAVFIRHGLPGYYPEKLMHVSIAWHTGDQRERTPPDRSPRDVAYSVPVDAVVCRIGKKEFVIAL